MNNIKNLCVPQNNNKKKKKGIKRGKWIITNLKYHETGFLNQSRSGRNHE